MCAVAGEIFLGSFWREGGDREERDVVATTAKKPGAQKKRDEPDFGFDFDVITPNLRPLPWPL